MRRGYWYVKGGDGRHYCFTGRGTFGGNRLLFSVEAEPLTGTRPDRREAHWELRNVRSPPRAVGFPLLIEGPPLADASESAQTNAAVRRHLQSTDFVIVEGSWYQKTKKAAQAWAGTTQSRGHRNDVRDDR
jgi:hypothetical protein